MAWTTVGNLRGPRGLQGLPGNGVTTATTNANGELVLTLTDGTSLIVGKVVGKDGVDGTSVAIQGSVADVTALPTDLTDTAQDRGKGYITQNDGHLHIWNGTDFTDVGTIQGPKGDTGLQGEQGIAGTKIFTGSGAPTDAIAAMRPGDIYIDVDTGDFYVAS